MSTKQKLPLDMIYHWETARAEQVYMTQPLSNGKTVDYTWRRAVGEARRMASYLKSLDLPPNSRIGIVSKNCAHWIMSDWAIWMAGHISVPLYPTLNADTVSYIIEHAEIPVLFVGKLDDWEMMKPGVPESVHCITYPLSPSTNFKTWDDIVAEHPPLEDNHDHKPDELATIVYTSGSTGRPKGVMLSFGNLSYAATGAADRLEVTSEDRYLSYLPLAHVFERYVGELTSMNKGFHLYFANTLDTFVEDLQRCEPTLFIAVPRIWTKFQHGVFEKMPKEKLDKLLKIPLLNRIVKKKILTNLGLQHVRYAGSGSAPLSHDILEWYRNLGLELLEGYGMSENIAYSHTTQPGRARTGYVGEALPGVDCKISEHGEVLVKSPATMMGYYKDPERTKEAFTEDGYLRTGDVGEIDELGRLKLTGRMKEIFKTSKGKYVAPAPIENKLMRDDNIEAVCVSGENQVSPFCLVMLSEAAQEKRDDPQFRQELEKNFVELLKDVNQTLDPHEHLRFMVVVKEPWTIENNFLTPTMKLKRNVVEDAYRSQVDDWYAQEKTVIWE